MTDGLQALRSFLDDIARRRAALAWRRAFGVGAALAAVVLFVTAMTVRLFGPAPLLLLATVALGATAALAAVIVALWSTRVATTPLQIARLVEERHGGLDDVVVTAVDYAARPDHDPPMADRLARSAVRAVSTLGADVVVDRDGAHPQRPNRAGRGIGAAGGVRRLRASARRRGERGVGLPVAVAHRHRGRSRATHACEPGNR